MARLVTCPGCGTALTDCPACGVPLRAGLCQANGLDERGRPTMTETYYCPSGCDDGRYQQAASRWRAGHCGPDAGSPPS